MENTTRKRQLTRDLSDNTMIYQGIRLSCKNDQGYCDPTTRTQATIVWFPEDTSTTFQVAKIHARMIKIHKKYFIQSIPYEQVNPSRKRSSNFRNTHNIENKLTRFQIYQETELACKHRNPLHKTQYSEILVEYEKGFDMTTGKKKSTHTPQVILSTKEHHIYQSIFKKVTVNLVDI